MSRIGRTIKTLHAEQDIPVGTTGAPFMVKNKHGERATSGVITLEFSAATGGTTFGNTLIIDGSSELSKGNITAIKDNAGNTWTQLNSITSTEPKGCCLDLWMATNIAAKSPYKVEITIALTSNGAYTAEVVEYAGVFELDTIETVNTAKTEEGFETTMITAENKVVILVSKEICEKLKVGMGASGGSIPIAQASPLTPVTTIVSVTPAKEEVQLSAAPTATEAGVPVTFGQAAIKTGTITFTANDVVFINYSGEITGLGTVAANQIKPAATATLPMTGFNTKGLVAYYFNLGSPSKIELPIAVAPVAPLPYSFQLVTFKFAPNNRGVAGTNALGELLGKVANTGKLDPTIQTAIPSFVAVIAPAWTTFLNSGLNEELVELTAAGSLQIRFESSATQARLHGTIKVKALQEVKEGARLFFVPSGTTNYAPVAEQRIFASFGPAVTELNTVVVASINTAREVTLPKATKVKAGEVIALDGTYPLT